MLIIISEMTVKKVVSKNAKYLTLCLSYHMSMFVEADFIQHLESDLNVQNSISDNLKYF